MIITAMVGRSIISLSGRIWLDSELESIDTGDAGFRAGLDVRARRGDGIPVFAAHLDFSRTELRAALAAERPGASFQIKARRRRALSGARS